VYRCGCFAFMGTGWGDGGDPDLSLAAVAFAGRGRLLATVPLPEDSNPAWRDTGQPFIGSQLLLALSGQLNNSSSGFTSEGADVLCWVAIHPGPWCLRCSGWVLYGGKAYRSATKPAQYWLLTGGGGGGRVPGVGVKPAFPHP